ncbi:SDR family oxidoreductase [Mangrovicoccus sp. HB161399]|uniref:SDR family oxidoreductase n=1 Tax=Mangrovicoccus sp. HB161399 TaxID=2720392 RepID=UPI001553859D|nr:SDR family oxidoreductase [Mangrovicoccus sp. HB161399]
MIGVTCASGRLGQLVIGLLREKVPAGEIAALMRSPEKAEELGLEVEVRPFDYNEPDQIEAGLEGIGTLLLISGSEVGLREIQHRNVILAAMAQGVGRIVYTSLLHAGTSPLKLATEHVATELMLAESGIPFTILRNGWYAENYIDTARSALEAGALYGAAGEGRISAASRRDYAEAAVAVLTSEGHNGRTYELSGDRAFSLGDLAGTISEISGTEIPYRDMPESDYAKALAEAGLQAPWPDFLARIDRQISEGALYGDGQALADLIGHPPASIRDILAGELSPAA